MDGSGNLVARYGCDPYGQTVVKEGVAADANPWRYVGAYLDSTGLYKMGARYYDPARGRFTQLDPLGNGYGYASDNPVNLTDPSGLLAGIIGSLNVDLGSTGSVTVNALFDFSPNGMQQGQFDVPGFSGDITVNLNFTGIHIDGWADARISFSDATNYSDPQVRDESLRLTGDLIVEAFGGPVGFVGGGLSFVADESTFRRDFPNGVRIEVEIPLPWP